MTSYRTPKTGTSEQIASKAKGETFIPISPSTLADWARVMLGLESSLACVEELLADYKGKVVQLESEIEGWKDEVKQLKEAVEYAKALCYKHSNGDDACHCRFYNIALGLCTPGDEEKE